MMQRRLILLGVLVVMALACTSKDTPEPTARTNTETMVPQESADITIASTFSNDRIYLGETSLDERIATSTAVVRATFVSVQAVAETLAARTGGYFGGLEFTFTVAEYLKGSGATTIKVLALDTEEQFATTGEAIALGTRIISERDTQWDSREALLFLLSDPNVIPGTAQADRYYVGGTGLGGSRDLYTLASRYSKRWLPENVSSTSGAGAAVGADEKTYLTAVPPREEGATGSDGVSGSSESRSSVTVSFSAEGNLIYTLADGSVDNTPVEQLQDYWDLQAVATNPAPSTPLSLSTVKARIAAIETEITANGGTQAYRDCVADRTFFERYDAYMLATTGTIPHRTYQRHDRTLPSGSDSSLVVYEAEQYSLIPNPAADAFEARLGGRDEGLFTQLGPFRVQAVRPLPVGEYRFFHGVRGTATKLCEPFSNELLRANEIFLTVTPPADAVYEAMFDPVFLSGGGVGASPEQGGLSRVWGSLGINGVKWHDGNYTVTVDRSTDLAGHNFQFISQFGHVLVDMPMSATTHDATARTYTWPEVSSPWWTGHQVMIRFTKPGGPSTLEPVDTVEPEATVRYRQRSAESLVVSFSLSPF